MRSSLKQVMSTGEYTFTYYDYVDYFGCLALKLIHFNFLLKMHYTIIISKIFSLHGRRPKCDSEVQIIVFSTDHCSVYYAVVN